MYNIMRPFGFNQSDTKKFAVPNWFSQHWVPDADAKRYWLEQYEKALRGEKHELPSNCLRMPENELHQLMSKEFWEECPKKFDSILDVGCSDGYMVKVLQEEGKKAIGINDYLYPTDMLYISEYELAVIEMDMHCLEFPDNLFDAVWCRHTLEHSLSPLVVLSEIYRVLKPGGYLFLVLPPVPTSPEPYDGHWHIIPDYQLRYLLEKCNFDILKLWTAWFSYKRENDNLEIRSISTKILL